MWVSAQGQKPSRRPQQTDSTNGWLGCSPRYALNTATLIGVMILKSSGRHCIVSVTTGFDSSQGGGDGSGCAVCVHSAEEAVNRSSSRHKLCLKYFGRNSCSTSFLLTARSLSMSGLFAFLAGMSVTTVCAGCTTSFWRVVSPADLARLLS